MIKKRIGIGIVSALALNFGCNIKASITAPGVKPTVAQTQECQEFTNGNFDASVNVDSRVRVFAQGVADYHQLGASIKTNAMTACAAIATDLGASDSWTALGDTDDAVSNSNGTGACDVANAKVNAIMSANASAHFAIVQVPGACYPDFAAQTACEAQCKADATCTSGTIDTRCTPAKLTEQCDESCKAQAECEGTETVPATCQGTCEAECTGSCQGTCTASDGTQTQNDPNCQGKCSAGCNGTCKGGCTLDVAISCGASVCCKGGCTSTYTAPRCETTFTPPACTVDANCMASCAATVAAKAPCDPPHAALFADVSVSPDVAKLVTTINANFGTILTVTDAQGALAHDQADGLVTAGENVVGEVAKLDVKSIACAAVAAGTSVDSRVTIDTAVTASTTLRDTCRTHAP
jgi:hypothetical protein